MTNQKGTRQISPLSETIQNRNTYATPTKSNQIKMKSKWNNKNSTWVISSTLQLLKDSLGFFAISGILSRLFKDPWWFLGDSWRFIKDSRGFFAIFWDSYGLHRRIVHCWCYFPLSSGMASFRFRFSVSGFFFRGPVFSLSPSHPFIELQSKNDNNNPASIQNKQKQKLNWGGSWTETERLKLEINSIHLNGAFSRILKDSWRFSAIFCDYLKILGDSLRLFKDPWRFIKDSWGFSGFFRDFLRLFKDP